MLSADELDTATRLGPRMLPILDYVAKPPMTLCHGDLRLDNVFWGSPENDATVTIIDWQISGKARGAYDVGYFMSQSVEPAVRAANEERIVREYHRQLVDAGVSGYGADQCWDDYRLATMFCLVYPVVACGSVDLANERGRELATKMLSRSLSAIRDLKADELLDRFEPQVHPLLA
jgi:aminoglycoside phosphotransferase (APT) family kinase protein